MYLKSRLGQGFTLIELLVVIAIIAIIAAILFPVFAQAREKARETVCLSNTRQLATAVQMYVQDYDETYPIFQAYNTAASGGAPGTPGHKGVEDQIMPYVKNKGLFQCPDDTGGPTTGSASYHDFYGSSYRFTEGCYTVVPGPSGSYEDDAPLDANAADPIRVVTDAMFQYPADTRIMRDEMLPWFGPDKDPGGATYGYAGAPPNNYYRQWHPRGGGFVFADGHAKFVVSAERFDQMRVDAEGHTSGAPDFCYWGCDGHGGD